MQKPTIHWLSFLALIIAAGPLVAQEKCQFGSSEAAESLESALQGEKTCKLAAALMDPCWWGSSADANFSAVLVEKCEKEFFSKLTPAATENYVTAMQLCAYEYARQQGTIAISEAAMCQAHVAEQYAADPASGDHTPPRASFDCVKAQSVLEKAICSDIRLGHADMVLAGVYKNAQKEAGPEVKIKLAQSEGAWLKTLPSKCNLSAVPLTEKQVSCLRDQIEVRFSTMDACGEGSDEDVRNCLTTIDDPERRSEIEPDEGMSRASFDCEKPKTGLEIAICADISLGQKDMELAHVYREADRLLGSSHHAEFVESERNWLRFFTSNCPLGAIGGIPTVLARACVSSAFEARIQQLQLCPQNPPADQISCLNEFRISTK